MSAESAFKDVLYAPESRPDWWFEEAPGGEDNEADEWGTAKVTVAHADHRRRGAPRVTHLRYMDDSTQAARLAKVLLKRTGGTDA